MRKVIVEIAVSLDGFIEGANREVDWFTPVPAGFNAEAGPREPSFSFDTVFYGRLAYERFGIERSFAVNQPGQLLAFNSMLTKMRKYVFSETVKHVPGNAMVIGKNFIEEVRRLKEEEGKNIRLCGGAKVVKSFSQLRLIDEYLLSVHPVILGSGKPLFASMAQRLELQLIEKKKLDSGVVVLRYRV